MNIMDCPDLEPSRTDADRLRAATAYLAQPRPLTADAAAAQTFVDFAKLARGVPEDLKMPEFHGRYQHRRRTTHRG